MKNMKKIICFLLIILFSFAWLGITASALSYTVVSGDSMWKIAVRYEIGLSEIISANPQIKNPNLIYPGNILTIPARDTAADNFEDEVIRLVNQHRGQNGLSPLKKNWELSRVARYKSQDMANKNYFSHTSPTYGSPSNMIKNFGISFRFSGENIAKGHTTPAAVVAGWMNSSGHRANILNGNYTQIGVGYVANGNIWTQMFIG